MAKLLECLNGPLPSLSDPCPHREREAAVLPQGSNHPMSTVPGTSHGVSSPGVTSLILSKAEHFLKIIVTGQNFNSLPAPTPHPRLRQPPLGQDNLIKLIGVPKDWLSGTSSEGHIHGKILPSVLVRSWGRLSDQFIWNEGHGV